MCSWKAGAGRVAGDRDEPLAGHRAQRVRRVADGHERVAGDGLGQPLDPAQVGLGARVAEAPLPGRRAAARARARVRGEQEHDAHAHGAGRLDDRQRERVGLLVGRAVRLVVDVVELADRGVAGAAARVEALLRDRAHARRIERGGSGVHRLAPRPEVVLGRRRGAQLDAAAQVALEGVRVPVDEPRDQQPAGKPDDVAPLPRSRRVDDRRDLPARELDRQAAAHAAAGLQHEIGDEQRAAHGSIGRSRPRSCAVSRASA